MVAQDRWNLPLAEQFHTLAGMRAVADDVAATEDVLDAEAIDFLQHRLKCRKVGVNVGNDCDGLHVHSLKGGCQADAAATWHPHPEAVLAALHR